MIIHNLILSENYQNRILNKPKSFMFLFNISTEHKAFIKKTQMPVFGISARHDSTISFILFYPKTLSLTAAQKQYFVVNIYIYI